MMSWSVNRSDKHICTKCGQLKSSEDFSWSNMSKGLKNSICNECRRKAPKRKSLDQRKVEYRVNMWDREQWTNKKTLPLIVSLDK